MSNLRAALEASLAANPDDVASHAAYGDLLMEQGDPRGEFIQVQLALEDSSCKGSRRKELQDREANLLLEHERAWLGGLADHLIEEQLPEYQRAAGYVNKWSFRRGWLDDIDWYRTDVEKVRALVRAPEARLLSRLSLGEVGYEDGFAPEPGEGIENTEYPCLHILQKAPFLANLRFLRVGEKVDFDEQYHNCRTSGEGLPELVAEMPRLEELQALALGGGMDLLFALNLPHLHTLVVYHEREVHPLGRLAANPSLAALRTLRIHPAHSYDEGYLPYASVEPLFNSPHLTGLRHLHLYSSNMGDDGVAELVRSGMLRRLETLDLRFGAVTDAGARMLANCPDTRRLKVLSLANNMLSEDGCRLLEGLGLPALRTDEQYPVGSDEYLMNGDME
jgi:uncharacterized protein (TIGR02996 family)